MEELAHCKGFQWDERNSEKIWIKHRVSRSECEQPFFNAHHKRPSLEDVVIASGKTQKEAEDNFKKILPKDKHTFVYLFQLKETKKK